MESAAAVPCAACGDDACAACRACSYALCRACLDEDAAEGRTTCARCGGEYATATDPGASRVAAIVLLPVLGGGNANVNALCSSAWQRRR
jgi:hypothetical protein